MTYINNNYKTTSVQRVCSIRALGALPGELTFSLEDRPLPGGLVNPVIPATVWGDSFRIYTTMTGGYKIRIYEKRRMIAIFVFDLLDDSRSDKTLGGSTAVYSEDSFYDDLKIDSDGNEIPPTPLHLFPEGDLVNH